MLRCRGTHAFPHHGDRLVDTRIVRLHFPRALEVRFRLRQVTDLEIEEGESLQRTGMIGRDPHRHVPFVERALVVVLVREDPRIQVVGIGEMRMPLEPIHGDAQRGIELALVAQCFAEPQEHEALRILGELGGERANVVSHG